MPTVSVSIELNDAEAAGMAALAEFFGMTEAVLLADALRFGLDLRRAEYEHDQAPPTALRRDDDIPS